MKKTTDGFRADEIESFEAPERGEFRNKAFYVIDGQSGFYRQLPKVQGDGPNVIRAWFQGEIVNLVKADAVGAEISEAGYTYLELCPHDSLPDAIPWTPAMLPPPLVPTKVAKPASAFQVLFDCPVDQTIYCEDTPEPKQEQVEELQAL